MSNKQLHERAATVEAETPLTAISATARRALLIQAVQPLTKSRRGRDDVNAPVLDHSHNAKPVEVSRMLGLPVGVTVLPTSLVCSRELPIDEWKSLGHRLWQLGGSVQWWLGDWWHYGAHRYGERKAAVRAKTFVRRQAFQTLMNYGWVAGKVEASRRREVLTFSHHAVVAPLEPEEQERWLDIAVKDSLSVAKLQNKIFREEIVKFTEDECIQSYTRKLMKAAQISSWFTLGGYSPWENCSFEQFLERYLERCFPSVSFEAFARALEEAAVFWSNGAQFVRRIESRVKTVRVEAANKIAFAIWEASDGDWEASDGDWEVSENRDAGA